MVCGVCFKGSKRSWLVEIRWKWECVWLYVYICVCTDCGDSVRVCLCTDCDDCVYLYICVCTDCDGSMRVYICVCTDSDDSVLCVCMCALTLMTVCACVCVHLCRHWLWWLCMCTFVSALTVMTMCTCIHLCLHWPCSLLIRQIIDLWQTTDFRLVPHAGRDTLIIYGADDIMAQLEESQVTIGTIRGSRYVGPIKVSNGKRRNPFFLSKYMLIRYAVEWWVYLFFLSSF